MTLRQMLPDPQGGTEWMSGMMVVMMVPFLRLVMAVMVFAIELTKEKNAQGGGYENEYQCISFSAQDVGVAKFIYLEA